MKGKKVQTTFIITLLVLSSTIILVVPKVSATQPYKIILPFSTSWERHLVDDSPIPGEAYGRINAVDWKTSDFYGYYGSNDPPPELGWRKSGDMGVTTPPNGTFYGFNLGSYYLMATGYFGSSYSYCYFSLFDTTDDSDYQPPVKVRNHTFINIFYYHYQLGNCMMDAQLFNKRTRQFWTLRDFNYDGQYIVDQNNVRIHPACRYNDPIGSWEFASFDLTILYESDPENWYITKIWMGFDNNPSIGDGATGQARTYFDLLTISYGLEDKVVQTTIPELSQGTDNAWVSGSVVAWHSAYFSGTNTYDLGLKVLLSGFDDGYFIYPQTTWKYNLYPSVLKVTVNSPYAQAREYPEPTGVNLTESDPDVPRSKVAQFLYDGCCVLAGVLPFGWIVSIPGLANEFYGLLKTPEPEPTYEWPLVDWGSWNEDPKNIAMGEVYIAVEGLTPGYHNILITLNVDYCYPVHIGMGEFVRHYLDTVSLEFNFLWSSEPDELPVSLYISASSGGTTNPAPGTYSYGYGSSVTVTATANTYYTFNYWLLDGSTYYQNPITVTMNSDHTLKAYFNRPVTVETRYFRGDQQTINGLLAYILGTSQSSTLQIASGIASGRLAVVWSSDVVVRHTDGSETTIGTKIAQVSRVTNTEGIQSASWTCPLTSLVSTDAVVIKVYDKYGAAGAWNLRATFITEQLGASRLDNVAWTFYYYTYRLYDGYDTYGDFIWGTSTYNSRIENFTWTP